MGLQINTNITALNALRNLNTVSGNVSTNIERLSSGLRINTAADDPAGLIISNSLQAQITGLNQAISNSQDAGNVIKTAEGGLTEVNNLLNNIRQLAVHAANTGVNDQIAVQADQTQISSAISSIERIAEQTQFGSRRLLDGTAGLTAAIVDTHTVSGINIGGTFGGAATQAGDLVISVNSAATRAQLVGGVNYASIDATLGSLPAVSGGANGGTVVINGQSVSVTGSDTVQTFINKINTIAATTGVSADFDGTNIVLTQQNYGANFTVSVSESAGILSGGAIGTAGTDANVDVTANVLVNGAVTTFTQNFVGGRGADDSGLKVTDTYGNSIMLTESGNDPIWTTADTVAQITQGKQVFQIGGNAGQTAQTDLGNVRTNALGATTVAGQNLSTIDVTTAQGATDAIKIVDEAIQQVSQLRANLGAFQTNTLQSTVRSLGVGVENLSASESQIRDTNVAQEVVSLTKNQIIQQAATSVLAQANQAPQQILRLLQ